MGRASAHTMVLKIFSAFSERKQWTQAELARRCSVGSEHVRRVLEDLGDEGWHFEREHDPPHVYWRSPEKFLPGVLLTPDDVRLLLLLLRRLRASKARDTLIERMQQAKRAEHPPLESAVGADDILALVDWAKERRVVLALDYQGHNDVQPRRRLVSVQHVGDGDQSRFVVRCHNDGKLKNFRFDNTLSASVVRSVSFQSTPRPEVEAFVSTNFDGYNSNEPPLVCVFYVDQRDAAWVLRNLPGRFDTSPDGDAQRFTISTSGVEPLARLLVGLGASVRIDTPVLRDRVTRLARGVLATNDR